MFNDRVLVIENDPSSIDVIVRSLGANGYDIAVAKSVQDGLVLYQKLQPELVMFDLSVIDYNGYEFFEQMSTTGSDSCSLMALTSGCDEGCLDAKWVKEGISVFLTKPLNAYEVSSVVKNTIELKRLQKEWKKEFDGRLRAENALSEMEGRYRYSIESIEELQTIFDNIPLGVAYIDKDFRFLKINSFLEKLIGLNSAELVGKNCYSTVGEFSKDVSKSDLEKICSFCKKDECFASKTATVIERPLGDMVLRVTTVPEFDDSGNIYRFLEIVEDITMTKYTEEKMVRNYQIQSVVGTILQISLEPVTLKEQLDQILDLIFSIPSLSLKSKGSIFVRKPGSDELIMMAVRGFNPAQIDACLKVTFGTCLCGIAAQTREIVYAPCIDERHVIEVDTYIPHGHYCVPIINKGEILGVINLYIASGHIRDKSEEEFLSIVANTIAGVIVRKIVEESLVDKEELLRSVVQSTKDAIVTIEGDGNILFWNRGAEDIFGYKEKDVKGQPLTIVIPERFREAHQQGINNVLTSGNSTLVGQTFEVVGLRRDGSEFPIELSLTRGKAHFKDFFTGTMRDITNRKRTEKELQKGIDKMRKTIGGIIQTISMTVEVRDPYTAGHQRRVANIARAIASEMKLSEEVVDGIRMAGVIHDIGKIYVPSDILSKPGKLNELEFGLIKLHSQIGYDILKTIDFPWPVATIILQHHEKVDGSGYPSGLKGEEILLEARILCVADVVEAISCHRPYRAALGIDTALVEISKNRGILYDPDVVDACLTLFREKNFTFE
ncbi:MAG: PAS domain S-box protein [Nitrospirae bacterium]|nr:PAS domain S-box protein [Nitrospirota bacterium]